MHPAESNITKWSHRIDSQLDQFEGDNKKAVQSRNCCSVSLGFFRWVLSALQPYV